MKRLLSSIAFAILLSLNAPALCIADDAPPEFDAGFFNFEEEPEDNIYYEEEPEADLYYEEEPAEELYTPVYDVEAVPEQLPNSNFIDDAIATQDVVEEPPAVAEGYEEAVEAEGLTEEDIAELEAERERQEKKKQLKMTYEYLLSKLKEREQDAYKDYEAAVEKARRASSSNKAFADKIIEEHRKKYTGITAEINETKGRLFNEMIQSGFTKNELLEIR